MFTTVRMRWPVSAGPGAAADLVGEVVHPPQDVVDIGDHVLSVDLERGVGREPERRVQDRPVLGDVDVLAPEHGVAPPGQLHLLGQLEERAEDGIVEQRLRQVDDQVTRGEGQPADPVGVVGEPGAQVGGEVGGEALEPRPRRRRARVHRRVAHSAAASSWPFTVFRSSPHEASNFSTPSRSRVSITSS